jgi:hypothetical protein
MKRIVIIGATSGIAERCARLWAAQGAHLLLAGRDAQRLAAQAQDLRVRGATRVETTAFEATDLAAPAAIVTKTQELFGCPDLVLIAYGILPDQARCQGNLADIRSAIEINGVSACLVAEAFAGCLESAGSGCIAVIGSVAGDRGRQSNYVYGAAKGLLEHYTQGLRNRLYRSGVTVVLIKPGPTETPMTNHLRSSNVKLASPDRVAKDIVRGIARGRAVIYTPCRWRFIMLIIRHIPEALFVRLKL